MHSIASQSTRFVLLAQLSFVGFLPDRRTSTFPFSTSLSCNLGDCVRAWCIFHNQKGRGGDATVGRAGYL